MDRIDRKILALLQKDASIRNVRLAELVGLAPSSCLRRVAMLKKDGTIRRVVALLDADRVGRGIKAIISVKLKEHDIASVRSATERFAAHGSVSQVYSISGETDVIVIMSVSTMLDFQATIQSILKDAGNIEQYFTQFVLEEHKFEPSL